MTTTPDWKIFIFSTHDITNPVGTTEAYYVSTRLAERCTVRVFTPRRTSLLGSLAHGLPGGRLLAILLLNLVYIPLYLGLALRSPPDVVYCYRNVIVPGLLFKTVSGATLVFDLRVDPYSQPKEFNQPSLITDLTAEVLRKAHQIGLSRADVIFTLSEPLRDRIRDSFHLPETPIHIIPLAVDTDTFTPSTATNSEFRIVYVGSMAPVRNLEIVIEAIGNLDPDVRAQTRLDLFGPISEEYRETLESTADASQVSLTFHGTIDHASVPRLVGECDIAVSPLPALHSFEVSSPAKVYEYLALGLPIVATDITAHTSILEHETDALLVPPGDVDQMSQAIQRLHDSPSLAEELSGNGRRKALENNWDQRVTKIVQTIAVVRD